MKKSILIIYLSFLLLPLHAAAENCSFYPGHSLTTFDIAIPATISIPRDTPNGTIIYESPPKTLDNINSSFICISEANAGIRNNVGGATALEWNALPIGDTGLAWQWKNVWGPLDIYPSGKQEAGGFGFNGSVYQLAIIKVADISKNPIIPAGVLGYMQRDEITTLGMSTRGTRILAQSCETPDITVDMGEHDISSFPTNGSFSNSIKFNIALNNCPPGINKVSYYLSPSSTSPVQNSLRGIIKLSPDSTARGIALQILDADGNPFVIHKDHILTDYSSTGGTFKIPMSARYFRVMTTGGNGGFDKGMRAGTANASITFIMSYL
ncbi:fimbrial protein [Pseudomonas glycinis]|uniref:fimbrial protein n=1 Tax=Pseudomonas atacamensis TaxID=2565368 RepID=UPI003C915753